MGRKSVLFYERFGINQYFYVIRMLKILPNTTRRRREQREIFYRKRKSFMNLESDLFLFMDGILMCGASHVCINDGRKSILSIGNI